MSCQTSANVGIILSGSTKFINSRNHVNWKILIPLSELKS